MIRAPAPGSLRQRRSIRFALAFAAGAALVLAHAPFGLHAIALASLLVLVELWLSAASPRAALWTGFSFGLGLFGFGVSWVYVSMHRFGAMPAPLAAFVTLGFCVLLALFPAFSGWLQARVGGPAALRAALAVPAAWTITEWLRGWILTGFPWLATGYAVINTPLAGFAPLGGVYAMSFVAVACAGLAWCVLAGRARWPAALALLALLGAGAALRTVQWTTPAGAPVAAALLQGNVPQDLKFSPARYAQTLDTYAELAERTRARLIVTPETAVPRFLDSVSPAYIARLERAARRNDGDLLLGVPYRAGPDEYYNSVLSLGVSPRQLYSKVHLVPFGEFVPPGFHWIVRSLSIPLSDFSRGPQHQAPLAVAGQKIAVDICYEDAYGAEIARALPQATLLVNVSNVAWFGDSLAPAQHLEIARLRALETGRMMLTATNTGITAAIGADGRVLARLPQFVTATLVGSAQGYSGATPYVRLRDWPTVGLSLALLCALALVARLRRSR
ncbi:MAG TPA: apolipoprotein N-acyltransferase [Burkholderiales bacterium]|nr:apolipoprotein N-acyltransferase [Burkholderiales bacterium]